MHCFRTVSGLFQAGPSGFVPGGVTVRTRSNCDRTGFGWLPSIVSGLFQAGPSGFVPGQIAAELSYNCSGSGCSRAVCFCSGTGLQSQKKFLRSPVPAPPNDPTSLSNRTGQNWPWRISVLLSAISHKEPPKKRWGSHALSLDLPVFTCHGWGQRVGRRRVAADIKGNGYRGARGKGCSARTAGVCLSAGTPRAS